MFFHIGKHIVTTRRETTEQMLNAGNAGKKTRKNKNHDQKPMWSWNKNETSKNFREVVPSGQKTNDLVSILFSPTCSPNVHQNLTQALVHRVVNNETWGPVVWDFLT